MKKIKVMISETFNPWFNLATEDWIFRDMDPETQILFLWRNQETVVIGLFPNPWAECNLEKMDQDNILLTRRQSGGGAVFHDLGNTNFTFLSGRADYDKAVNNKIITNALAQFGIEAKASGRNDIIVSQTEAGETSDRKISGSAFKETKDRCFHHGTLLINANLAKLGEYLSPAKKKLVSKGITSVRSRVANLSDLNPEVSHDTLCKAIISEFFKHYGSKCEIEILDESKLKTIPALSTYFDKLKDWNWRFGETPEFDHHLHERFDWGAVDVHINSKKGKIQDIKIFSDSLHPEMIEHLNTNLQNVSYNPEGIKSGVSKTIVELPMIEDYLFQFESWLSTNIQ